MPAEETRIAEQLEAEALTYPDERGEILLEAAEAWDRCGRRDRAVTLLTGLVDSEPESRCLARLQLLDMFLRDGDTALAEEQLTALSRDPALTAEDAGLTAEFLTAAGDLEGASRWYDRATARLTPEQLDALHSGDQRRASVATIAIRGRREVRERLGQAPDVVDELTPQPPREGSPQPGFAGPQRRLIFQRDQRRLAQQRWPGVYDQDEHDYYATAEHNWRLARADGVPLVLVPAQVDALVEYAAGAGSDPTATEVRTRYALSLPAEDTLAWPPQRNAPCWCGSSRKYKKCCGSPAH